MPAYYKFKLQPFIVFYKSTLTLSICFAVMAATFALMSGPVIMIRIFGVSFMTGGTILSLLYKEISLKHEYYFYYNQSISKTSLILTCAVANMVVGITLIAISFYA